MHIPARTEDFASPPMHKVTSPLILCAAARLSEEGCVVTQHLAACWVSLFNLILCSAGAVLRRAEAHVPDLEASESTIARQV